MRYSLYGLPVKCQIINVSLQINTSMTESALCFELKGKKTPPWTCPYPTHSNISKNNNSTSNMQTTPPNPSHTLPAPLPPKKPNQKNQNAQTNPNWCGWTLFHDSLFQLHDVCPQIHIIVTGSRVLHLEPKEVEAGLSELRPYHGVLLLQSVEELRRDLPLDSSPALVRLVKVITPLKNLLTLSLDSDLSLSQVGVLLWWIFAVM